MRGSFPKRLVNHGRLQADQKSEELRVGSKNALRFALSPLRVKCINFAPWYSKEATVWPLFI
jgi:hypothetical protein